MIPPLMKSWMLVRVTAKGKKHMKSEEESSLTETKLSDVFLEIQGQMLKEQ